MSLIRWSEQETSKLIDLYKMYSFLWDSSHELYKKARVRALAYSDIHKKMNKPNLSVRDIRCKVKNLRSAYYQELKKKYYAQTAGKEYQCSLAWFDNFKEIMDSITTNKDREDQPEEEAEVSDNDESDAKHQLSADDTIIVNIKQEFLDEMEHKDVRYSAIISEYLEPVPIASKKKKNSGKTFSKPIMQKQLQLQPKLQPKPEDEFQLFANNMAEQLRTMPLDKALNLQVEVQALIAKERIDIFNKTETEKSMPEAIEDEDQQELDQFLNNLNRN